MGFPFTTHKKRRIESIQIECISFWYEATSYYIYIAYLNLKHFSVHYSNVSIHATNAQFWRIEFEKWLKPNAIWWRNGSLYIIRIHTYERIRNVWHIEFGTVKWAAKAFSNIQRGRKSCRNWRRLHFIRFPWKWCIVKEWLRFCSHAEFRCSSGTMLEIRSERQVAYIQTDFCIKNTLMLHYFKWWLLLPSKSLVCHSRKHATWQAYQTFLFCVSITIW